MSWDDDRTHDDDDRDCDKDGCCPNCGKHNKTQFWHEDGQLVEWCYKCQCGYEEGWSYGHSFGYNPADDEKEGEED